MNNDSFPGEADSDELCAHHDTLIMILVLMRWALTGPQQLDQETLYRDLGEPQ